MSTVARAEQQAYTAALRAGHGFDDNHRGRLAALQRAERRARNTDAGYGIAATNPVAAHHAVMVTLEPSAITWAVIATDGVSDGLQYRRCDWADLAHQDAAQLGVLLDRIHQWEEHDDPHAQQLPRAKRHDDKTIAALPSVW